MPIPSQELSRWCAARVRLPDGTVLPDRSLPAELGEQVWVLPLEAALLRSLQQRGQPHLEVELWLDEAWQPALMLLEATRRKAVQLGYKRKLWAVLGFGRAGAQVVYTGLNSRTR